VNRFTPFDLLAWQAARQEGVDYCLADSGCQPLRLEELLTRPGDLERFLKSELAYPATRGGQGLREAAALWHGAAADEVLVTVGAAEAISIAVSTLVGPGDHVVAMTPGYYQAWGACLNQNAEVSAFPLLQHSGWRPDLDSLERIVGPKTRLITLTNPNNPAGTVLTEPEMAAVVAAADRVGAWILADEVHRGTEFADSCLTPSFWGRYERTVCVGSLSKAFGMPGARVGWLVAPRNQLQELWRRHEYATVSTSSLSMFLAEIALAPHNAAALLSRYRSRLRSSRYRLEQWVEAHEDLVSMAPAQATALGLVRCRTRLSSLELADELYRSAAVLVAPGAHFGAEGHIRITHGLAEDYLEPALARIAKVLEGLDA
jgi:aspartate/methionine/tyrosine aminotransferase